MKPELPNITSGETTSLHSREVEYALILSQMVSVAEDDPSQMRLAIYEFARAKLNHNTSFVEESERKQLSAALEAAILGVERFSSTRDTHRRAQREMLSRQLPDGHLPKEFLPRDPVRSDPVQRDLSPMPTASLAYQTPSLEHGLAFKKLFPAFADSKWLQASQRHWFAIGLSLVSLLAGIVFLTEMRPTWRSDRKISATATSSELVKQPASSSTSVPAVNPERIAPFLQVPSDYGVYAADGDGKLVELQALAQQVPDRRVAMSTPIAQPSQTTLPDGHAKFVIYRRDLAGNSPDRFEVRAVARVARIMAFDAKGKPTFSDAPAEWIIRNIAYEFKVRPAPASPEMLLVQPKDADLELPPGRYVLVIKDQGYDFTVAGDITDAAQCLERMDAANGSFYSACQTK